MIIIVYLYRAILPILSLFENARILSKHFPKQWKYEDMDFITCRNHLAQFDYIPDRTLKILSWLYSKIVKKDALLTMNYIPFLRTVELQNGGDCSCHAWWFFYRMRKLGYKPKLYMIMNGNDLSTAHVISVTRVNGGYYISNVNELIYCENEKDFVHIFRDRPMVSIGRYDNLKWYRWA